MNTLTLPDGRYVQYEEIGNADGPAVLLYGGRPATAHYVHLLDEAAADVGARVIGISRPGYGASTWTSPSLARIGVDAGHIADALGLDRFAVVGYSGGGPAAAAVGAQLGDRVARLGLATALSGWTWDGDRTETDAAMAPWLERFRTGDEDTAVAGIIDVFRGWFGPLRGTSDAEITAGWNSDVDGEVYTDHFRRVVAADIRRVMDRYDGAAFDVISTGTWDVDLSRVSAPTTLWYGVQDHVVPLGHAQWYLERIRHADLIVVHGCGHDGIHRRSHATEILSALLADSP